MSAQQLGPFTVFFFASASHVYKVKVLNKITDPILILIFQFIVQGRGVIRCSSHLEALASSWKTRHICRYEAGQGSALRPFNGNEI
jgi:hypothetical protein